MHTDTHGSGKTGHQPSSGYGRICGVRVHLRSVGVVLMLDYLIRRLIGTVPVLLAVSAFVFLFVHLLPGDPARLVAGPDASLAGDRLGAGRHGPR